MKVKSEPESVECCACDELNDEPLDLSIPALRLVKTEIKSETDETENKVERFIDLTSDDEELSSDPKVLPIVDTEIQSDSFVDLISDDEEIFQYPSPSTSSLVPPLIKPEIPHIKPELSDGLNDTVANEPTDEEQLAGGKEAPLDDRSPRSNHEYDKHNSDRGAPLGDQLSSGLPSIGTDDEMDSECSADEADGLNISFDVEEAPKEPSTSSPAPPLTNTDANCEYYNIEECQTDSRDRHVILFPQGPSQLPSALTPPLTKTDRSPGRFAVKINKNHLAHRASAKSVPPVSKKPTVSMAQVDEFTEYEVLQRPKNYGLVHSMPQRSTNNGSVFSRLGNNVMVHSMPQRPLNNNINELVHSMIPSLFHRNVENVRASGYQNINCGHPNPWQYNINVNVYQPQQQQQHQPKKKRLGHNQRRQARKRAQKEREAQEQSTHSDRQQAQHRSLANEQPRMHQPPHNERNSQGQSDTIQTIKRHDEWSSSVEKPASNILPWQLNPSEPAPLDFGWTNWSGYQPS